MKYYHSLCVILVITTSLCATKTVAMDHMPKLKIIDNDGTPLLLTKENFEQLYTIENLNHDNLALRITLNTLPIQCKAQQEIEQTIKKNNEEIVKNCSSMRKDVNEKVKLIQLIQSVGGPEELIKQNPEKEKKLIKLIKTNKLLVVP